MLTNTFTVIAQIETRLSELQKAHVALQEQLKQAQHALERNVDDSAIRIIDVLDMIEAIYPTDVNDGENANAQRMIKKIEKRLLGVLQHWGVQAVQFSDGRIEVGKARVLETRNLSGEPGRLTGTIAEICRKGYQRGDKTIRPADVITWAPKE